MGLFAFNRARQMRAALSEPETEPTTADDSVDTAAALSEPETEPTTAEQKKKEGK